MPLAALGLFLATVATGGGLTLVVPDGWRQLDAAELERLTPKTQPQNEFQRRLKEGSHPAPLIAMKHDVEGSSISAGVQVFRAPIPKSMRYASSIELARMAAFGATAAYRGTTEVEPRELTVAGRPAAEFVQRYTLVGQDGTKHDMRSRLVVIATGDVFYNIGYAGPAADADDFKTFDQIVRSATLAR